MERFAGRTILVTGSTGGLGRAIAHRLAEEGGQIVVTDLESATCQALAKSLPGHGHTGLRLDVSSEPEWADVVTTIENQGNGLDVLINNAAIGSLATVETEERDAWDRLIAIDQTGVWLGLKHAGALIERSGGGAIVNMSSILGTGGGLGTSIAYHAAKGAVRSMTKNAALHWATRGVRVNSLHPGFIGTSELLQRFEGSERHASMLANTPMGRLGSAEEIAGTVAFMASDDAGFMTGSEVYADGGWTAR